MTTRADAAEILARGYREVGVQLEGISDDDLMAPATIGGGDWSAKDLLGHLTTWEDIALATIDAWRRGERPAIDGTLAAGGTDDLNVREVERKAPISLEEIRLASRDVHERLMAALVGLSDEEWARPPSWDEPRAEMLGAALGGILGATGVPFGHVSAHEADLRAFAEARRRTPPQV
jgi:hypothetical protein